MISYFVEQFWQAKIKPAQIDVQYSPELAQIIDLILSLQFVCLFFGRGGGAQCSASYTYDSKNGH